MHSNKKQVKSSATATTPMNDLFMASQSPANNLGPSMYTNSSQILPPFTNQASSLPYSSSNNLTHFYQNRPLPLSQQPQPQPQQYIVDKNSVDSNNNFSLDEDFDVNFLPDQTDLTADVNMFDEPPAAVNSSYMAVTSTNYTVGGSAISNNGAQYSTTQQNQIVYRQPQMHYQQQQQHQQQQIMQLNGYSYGGGKQFSNEQTNYMNNEMNNLNNSGSLVHHLLLE